ncbi:pyridoxamine 5'-phosphate oxidase-related protein FMN-binding protein [Cellulomonas flavigena DSM 20109]|uniref:Pyridoxamine 5'-phosphate oxidase-related protein FMN-binding protein n=1 Tax=Cellulomonas flavigena (strain ATCC 482 / DSM 20109 / BCRC 11376 / JCM 18109 / NBRC 3775 / NCIMB 8073 / NRS 134) TaxID=446466 RepID=D5UIR3_CELFN|nr:pyridoxamine 5'-phosphate oxidase family protein [Cellulomonas flavigena]ADG73562.1 pyridoxamine 5'-phosphate oxidase-related protein FMN-binding protein [Cellulomonas flavigena DSM 20109]
MPAATGPDATTSTDGPALTTDGVWRTLARQPFMVIGMVNGRGEGRSAGVSLAVHDDALWTSSDAGAWKTRHLRHQPEVSVTVPVRRGGVLALVAPIPPAVVTCNATAHVLPAAAAPGPVRRRLLRGLKLTEEVLADVVAIRLVPHGDFVTYGLGVSLLGMLDTERARGRVPVARA